MKSDWQAWAIKFFAVVTATPRWVAALLAAEGLRIPPEWGTWWLPLSALMSAGMAVVEGWAFAYVFQAWRNQGDRKSDRLLWLALLSAALFVIVLAPYVAASVSGATVSAVLSAPWALWLWSSAVAASTIAIVAAVGFAQRESRARSSGAQAKPRTYVARCDVAGCEWEHNGYKSAAAAQNAVNAHKGKAHKECAR